MVVALLRVGLIQALGAMKSTTSKAEKVALSSLFLILFGFSAVFEYSKYQHGHGLFFYLAGPDTTWISKAILLAPVLGVMGWCLYMLLRDRDDKDSI
ncbi:MULTISPECIES: hypothetical protein [unclassified Pseudoxanthomonas]|uniref:hypothetical protein n=1 Tax=unclassified Pseudoxanthomonas TaxID=2645906 RepID=UPI0030789834